MYNRGLLLFNGNAGQDDVEKNMSTILPYLTEKINELTIIRSRAEGDIEKACASKGGKVDLIIILGGDGTVHEAVNGCSELRNPPPLLILPTGTCNDFSRALSIPASIEEAVRLIDEGTIYDVPIPKANDRSFSNFAGVGLIVEASEGTNKQFKQWFGKISYFLSAIQSLKEPSVFTYTVEINGKKHSGEAVMILAMNGQYLGTLDLQLPQRTIETEHLTLFIIKEANLSLLKDLFTNPSAVQANEEIEQIECMKTDAFHLQTEPSLPVDMDGEIYLQSPITVAYKTTLRFIGASQQ